VSKLFLVLHRDGGESYAAAVTRASIHATRAVRDRGRRCGSVDGRGRPSDRADGDGGPPLTCYTCTRMVRANQAVSCALMGTVRHEGTALGDR